MFSITPIDYSDKQYDSWEIPYGHYHCLYILENGKDAYIGETNNPIRRGKEHNGATAKNKQYRFTKMHIITGKWAEETPFKHFENLLIRLMRADKKFNIVNDLDGENPEYHRKSLFELKFDKLWLDLEEKGLVNTKDFDLIINSNTCQRQ